MEFINAKEAAKTASAARAEIALMKTSIAERCVKDCIMPYIAEEAVCGKNVAVVEVTLNSDAYSVRNLMLSILIELGYGVKLGNNGTEFIINW